MYIKYHKKPIKRPVWKKQPPWS